jgi:hypothetical protein
VEKSVDGTRFSNAGEVAAKGNNSSESYQWLDVNTATGKNYYRVRALQNDGKYFISKIVIVNMNVVKSLITVYPNPVKNGQINIHSDNIEKGTYNVELYDGRGRQIISEVIHHSGGLLHQIIYPGNKLTPGVYHLKVTNITEHFSQTIFIE